MISVIVHFLGTVPKGSKKILREVEIRGRIETSQNTARSTRLLRRDMDLRGDLLTRFLLQSFESRSLIIFLKYTFLSFSFISVWWFPLPIFPNNYIKKEKVPRKNNYPRRLCRWHSDSGKHTRPTETLLHSLERAAADIGLHVNARKTEYMCFNQTGDISTLSGSSLKLVDKFTYLGSSVSSTEKDIVTRLTKAWTAIKRLSVIWKSDMTDKMKRSFFQTAVVSILLYGCTTWMLTKRLEKKLDGN